MTGIAFVWNCSTTNKQAKCLEQLYSAECVHVHILVRLVWKIKPLRVCVWSLRVEVITIKGAVTAAIQVKIKQFHGQSTSKSIL